MHKKLATLIYLIILIICAPNKSMAITLQKCIKLGMAQNLTLQQERINHNISKNNLKQKQAQTFGSLSTIGSYYHYNMPRTLVPMTPAGMSKDVATTTNLSMVGLKYTLPLFTGFAHTSNIVLAELQQKINETKINLSVQQIVYNIKNLYLQSLSLQHQLSAQKKYTQSLNKLYEQIDLGVKIGKNAKVDLLKITSELEQSKATQTQILNSNQIVKATLANLIDIPKIDKINDIDINIKPINLKLNKSLNPDIKLLQIYKQADLAILSDNQIINRNKSKLYPQISFDAIYGQNFGPNDSTNAVPNTWNHTETWQVGINLKWDIFDFGKNKADIKQAELHKRQSLLKKLQIEKDLKLNIYTAIRNINTAIANYNSAKTEYDLTNKTQNIELIKYRYNAINLNDLLQAKAKNQIAKSKIISSKYTYQDNLYYLDYLLEKGTDK